MKSFGPMSNIFPQSTQKRRCAQDDRINKSRRGRSRASEYVPTKPIGSVHIITGSIIYSVRSNEAKHGTLVRSIPQNAYLAQKLGEAVQGLPKEQAN